MAQGFTRGDNVTVRKNSGTDVGTRPRLNLIEGDGIGLTVADDGSNNEIDVTVASTRAPTRYTTTQTLTGDDYLVNGDGTAFTFTLPDVATVAPHAILIFAGGSGNITIARQGSDLIDGVATSKVLTGGETPPATACLVCYNATDDWITVSTQGTVT